MAPRCKERDAQIRPDGDFAHRFHILPMHIQFAFRRFIKSGLDLGNGFIHHPVPDREPNHSLYPGITCSGMLLTSCVK